MGPPGGVRDLGGAAARASGATRADREPELRDLGFGQGWIVLEFGDADVAVDVPGRHLAAGDFFLDRAGPRPGVLDLARERVEHVLRARPADELRGLEHRLPDATPIPGIDATRREDLTAERAARLMPRSTSSGSTSTSTRTRESGSSVTEVFTCVTLEG